MFCRRGLTDIDVLIDYVEDRKFIYTGLENRITFVWDNSFVYLCRIEQSKVLIFFSVDFKCCSLNHNQMLCCFIHFYSLINNKQTFSDILSRFILSHYNDKKSNYFYVF